MKRAKRAFGFSQQKVRELQRESIERGLSQPPAVASCVVTTSTPNALLLFFSQDMDVSATPSLGAFTIDGTSPSGASWVTVRMLSLNCDNPVALATVTATALNGLKSAAALGAVPLPAFTSTGTFVT